MWMVADVCCNGGCDLQYCHLPGANNGGDTPRTHLSVDSAKHKEDTRGAYLTESAFIRMCRVQGIVPPIGHHKVK